MTNPKKIKIEKLIYGGSGLGYLDDKVCFVEDAIPLEVVTLKDIQDKKKFLTAKVDEILEHSEAREIPSCRYYAECGGCQYQHVQYKDELKWKENQVREAFVRGLRVESKQVKNIVPSKEEKRYRNSVTLHHGEKGWGFFGDDNKTVIPIDDCELLKPELQKVFREIDPKSKRKHASFKLSKDDEILPNESPKLYEVEIANKTLFTSSQGFFQNNEDVTEKIIAQLKQWVDEVQPETFLDLYAGMGLFSFTVASKVKRVVCVEEHPESMNALLKNEKKLGQTIEAAKSKVEAIIKDVLASCAGQKTIVMLDPPRQGLHKNVVKSLTESKDLKTIVYLSCHMGSMIRDLKLIAESSDYKIDKVVPFDMFPQTKHIEIMALLKR